MDTWVKGGVHFIQQENMKEKYSKMIHYSKSSRNVQCNWEQAAAMPGRLEVRRSQGPGRRRAHGPVSQDPAEKTRKPSMVQPRTPSL